MKIMQLLPELNSGGVERGTLEIARALIAAGHESIVVSNGGRLVAQLEAEGFKVSTYIHGLGENAAVQKLFVERANESWDALEAK